MASTLALLLLLSAGLFTVKAGDDCKSYLNINNEFKNWINCYGREHCCGSCNHRYCCSSEYFKLSESDQNLCTLRNNNIVIGSLITGVILIAVFITCCCIYKMCRTPRRVWTLILTAPIHYRGSIAVAGAHVTTISNAHFIQQQPVMQAGQYPQYQPVPTQPGYGQPMQTGLYQGQPYAPGPPPSYHVAVSPGYPTGQSAYDGGQAMYPMQPPAQPGVMYMPSETLNQPAYNPAYVQPPNIAY